MPEISIAVLTMILVCFIALTGLFKSSADRGRARENQLHQLLNESIAREQHALDLIETLKKKTAPASQSETPT